MAGKPKKRPEKSQPRYLDPDSWIYAESSPRVRVAGNTQHFTQQIRPRVLHGGSASLTGDCRRMI